MKLRMFLVVALVMGLIVPGMALAEVFHKCEPGKPCPCFAKLTGEWRGLAETRNDRIVPESLKVVLNFAADGKVTGKIGDWKLVDGTLQKTHDWERKRAQSEFIITGNAEGMKTPAGGKTLVNININFDNLNSASGTLKGYAARKNNADKITWQTWNLTHFNRLPGK